MKKVAALVAIATFVTSGIRAEVESLLDQGTWGMWFRAEVGMTRVGSEDTEAAGVQLGVALNRTFYLGWGYGAQVGTADYGTPRVGKLNAFDLWYTGPVLAYSVKSSKLVHADASLLIGGGRVSAELVGGGGDEADLLVTEPSVALLVNVSPTVELGLVAGWRLVSSSGIEGLGEGDLGGPRVGLVFRCTESRELRQFQVPVS
ncbi:MAG: hypothetical protein N2255_06145, partial [Kiritimatiellae bacterium]|nr:hypothetical protein [Kiritimatiellia bacterium]